MQLSAAGRIGVTPEEVAAAADRIVARGDKPTLRAVRAELGGGSMGTIQRDLAAWREKQKARVEPGAPSLPPEVQRPILLEIERRLTETRAALEGDLGEVNADREALVEEVERQGAALAAAEQRAAEQAVELERRAGTIAQLERDRAEMREQLAGEREAAEAARRAESVATVRAEAAQAELVTLRGELKVEREARGLAEIAAAELRGPQGKKL